MQRMRHNVSIAVKHGSRDLPPAISASFVIHVIDDRGRMAQVQINETRQIPVDARDLGDWAVSDLAASDADRTWRLMTEAEVAAFSRPPAEVRH